MPKAFTEAEKAQIHAQLIEAGRTHFGQYGLKKTSIDDLTQAVGIARSSFYLFFVSKEALFLHITELDRAATQAGVMQASFEAHTDPAQALAAFVQTTLAAIDANPLARRLLAREEFEALARRLTPDQIAQQRAASVDPLLPYIEAYQAQGKLPPEPPDVIAGALRAVVFLALHEAEIGVESYPAVMDLLVRALAAGLTGTALLPPHVSTDEGGK